jgi:hypothetical protein
VLSKYFVPHPVTHLEWELLQFNLSLVHVEFKYTSSGGGFTNVAVYENGRLTLSE